MKSSKYCNNVSLRNSDICKNSTQDELSSITLQLNYTISHIMLGKTNRIIPFFI